MQFLAQFPPVGSSLFLFLALALALSFEFVNGFHDTANAVATVIYTHTLKPTVAVIWSGIWNLIGVLTSGGAVAFGIVALLPAELVLNVGSAAGFAMVFALLVSAIIWNLGTWYLGLPASSSHTLIGSIMGVGLANSFMSPGHVFGEGVNWVKAKEVGMALLISPCIGFCVAALLLLACKALVKNQALYSEPPKDKAPPFWIRVLLMLTCTGVSFAHGSNDGQKGMGLIMLILVGILPGTYALKMSADSSTIHGLALRAQTMAVSYAADAKGEQLTGEAASTELSAFLKSKGRLSEKTYAALADKSREISEKLKSLDSFEKLPEPDRRLLRTDFYLVAATIGKLSKSNLITDPAAKAEANSYKDSLDKLTKFIPDWVKYAVALALGLGTMIGWKRIVVTVGEKIGRSHLTYAQGASAELVAMSTIGLADYFGLPVSTTHVLSSGIAGTMAANRSGLQAQTLRNILLAWVLTLPACIFLGAAFFSFALYFVFNVLGLH